MTRGLVALVAVGSLLIPSPVLAADPTVTTLTADVTTFDYRTEVAYTASVQPIPDGGVMVLKIRDFDGDVVVYLSRLLNMETGSSTFRVQMGYELPPAEYSVTATYLGTDAFSASASDPLAVVLNRNPSSTRLRIWPVGLYDVLVPGASIRLDARVSHTDRGKVRFYDVTSGTPEFLGQDDLRTFSTNDDYAYADLRVDGVTEGSHTFLAEFSGSVVAEPSDDTVTADFAWGVPVRLEMGPADPNPVMENHRVSFNVNLDNPRAGVAPTGTITVVNMANGRVVAEISAQSGRQRITIDAPRVGTYTYRAEYTGDEHFLPDVSKERGLRVVRDIVEAEVWSLPESFWPSPRDGIADTIFIAGYGYEPIRVEISIYAQNGELVRDWHTGFDRGRYVREWDGRDEGGKLLREGEYRVVQELHDSFGNELRVRAFVDLIHGVP